MTTIQHHPVTSPGAVPPDATTELPPVPAADPQPPDGRPAPKRPTLAAVGVGLSICAALLLGFVVYLVGVSSVQEAHNQLNNYNKLRSQLDGATAPVGPVAPGTPVALVDIPAIGLHHVVIVQGTSAGNLMQGPGLRSDTPLPGEAGVSVVYGRRTTFGGPFGRVPSLHVGDTITTTTGHGVAHYRVTMFSTDGQPVHDSAANRLVLVTANSSFSPSHVTSVSAVLVGTALPDDGGYPAVSASGQALAGDESVLLVLMLWSLALVVVAAAGTYAAQFWSRWPAWLLTAPVVLAVVWNVYENAAHLLPNLL